MKPNKNSAEPTPMYIYGLYDKSDTNEKIRFIGATSKEDLTKILKEHKKRFKHLDKLSKKELWVKEVSNAGSELMIVLLQVCDDSNHKKIEKLWNDKLGKTNDLLNRVQSCWTIELIIEIAKKYTAKKDFILEDEQAYWAASERGILPQITSHMTGRNFDKRMSNGYWTKEKCWKESKKYDTRTIFSKKSGGAYTVARKNNWLDEICSHMKPTGNWVRRLIYVYLFSDNCVYVGLTYNIKSRDHKHKNSEKSIVYKHIKKTGLTPELTYSDFFQVDVAQKLEGKVIERFRKMGYTILNIRKPGGLGGGILKWTFDKCKKEALKYKTRWEFGKNNIGAYKACLKYGWLDEVCSHMSKPKGKPSGYWTKERCAKEAKKYKTRKKFCKGEGGAYGSAYRNNWLDEICSHMKKSKNKPKGYWTKEKCLEEALKYKIRSDFYKNGAGAPTVAIENNWMDEICSHMVKLKRKPRGYWTKVKCEEEALKYKTRNEFKENSSAYSVACINNWLDEICSHMFKLKIKPNGYWTKEKCAKKALKYKTRKKFRKGEGGAYSSAHRNNWLDEICSHMIKN